MYANGALASYGYQPEDDLSVDLEGPDPDPAFRDHAGEGDGDTPAIVASRGYVVTDTCGQPVAWFGELHDALAWVRPRTDDLVVSRACDAEIMSSRYGIDRAVRPSRTVVMSYAEWAMERDAACSRDAETLPPPPVPDWALDPEDSDDAETLRIIAVTLERLEAERPSETALAVCLDPDARASYADEVDE